MSFPASFTPPCTWDIPADAVGGMLVPARVYADRELFGQISGDRSLQQLVNVACLPGISGRALAMPDAHEGYGFPVGGVAAFRTTDGVISPGGVGYDINCGVRLLASSLAARDIGDALGPLLHELSRAIPSGTGRGSRLDLDDRELDRVFTEGTGYLVQRGMATPDDAQNTEAHGCLGGARPAAVSQRARDRGRDQLGTIGSGNHFVEVQEVAEVLSPPAAAAYGLQAGMLVVLVHTGSRGLGHQVCTDYVRRMDRVMAREGIRLRDRELACAPFASPEGQEYFGAMNAAANFAWCNRQVVTHRAREAFRAVLGPGAALRLVYDVAHNIAKVERYGEADLVVHRKGATRAFGPANPETPDRYRAVGQPVLIPGSMGTASYVLAGADAALAKSFGSCCHGAGRAMSRGAARRKRAGREVRQDLEAQGIVVRGVRDVELAEEAPYAYKDVDRVVDVVAQVGLATPVARLRPLGVVKG